MRRSLGAAALCALTGAGAAHAQSVVETVFEDAKNMVLDIGAVWTSPFRGAAGDYGTAGMIAGATGLLFLVDEPVADWVRDHQHTAVLEALKPLREYYDPPFEKISQAPKLDQIPLALYVVGLALENRSLRDAATGCLAGHQAQGLPRHYFYKVLGRERPLVVDGAGRKSRDQTDARPGDPFNFHVPGQATWYDNSFPGGHTLNIATCVSYLNHRFDLGAGEPLLWALAAGISAGRLADQRHWTSDTFLSGVLGIAVGRYLAARSLERLREDRGEAAADGPRPARGAADTPGGISAPELVVAPVRGGAMVGWRIRF